MKKIMLISGAFYMLTSFAAVAQTTQWNAEHPNANYWNRISPDWSRRDGNYDYWRHQAAGDHDSRDWGHEREEARDNDWHDNGHHYAYGKDKSKHHDKDSWKKYPKNHHHNPAYQADNRGRDHDRHDDDDRR